MTSLTLRVREDLSCRGNNRRNLPGVSLDCAPSLSPLSEVVLRSRRGCDFGFWPEESLPSCCGLVQNGLFPPLCAHLPHRQPLAAVRNFWRLTWASPAPDQARPDAPLAPAPRTAARLAPPAATVPDTATSHGS